MTARNLEPGQYQIGSFVFGSGTQFNVEDFVIAGWEVNVQDSQASLSDELRFGSDSFRPNPIQITMTAQRNRVLPNVAGMLSNPKELNFSWDRHIGDFTREWRADEIRKEWGALKPLYVCRPDGSTVQVYGRPGKLAVSRESPHSLTRNIVAEYRRSDTLAYNEFEWYLQVRDGESKTVFRNSFFDQGDAPCWLRFILVGPMEHPIIQLGTTTIELDYELEPGDIVEINSYPWSRRCIRVNDGLNLSAYLVSPYLEKLNFPVDQPIELSWNATGANEQSETRDFSNYSNTSEGLPTSDWFATDYSSGTGQYKLVGGELVWEDDGNDDRLATSIFKLPTVTPYQLVSANLATLPEGPLFGAEECTNRLIGQSNAAGTEYMYWDISYSYFWYGYHKNGVDYQLSPRYEFTSFGSVWKKFWDDLWADIFQTSVDWKIEAEFGTGAGLLTSTLRINDSHVYSFKNTSGIGLTENLYTGIGMRATSRFAGQSTPGKWSNFHMRDNNPEPANVSSVYMFWRDAWQNI